MGDIMEEDKESICQLQLVYESGDALTIGDRLLTGALRINSAIKRRLERYVSSMEVVSEGVASVINMSAKKMFISSGGYMVTGDLVEVLSMDEIKRTLDINNKCEGLGFMPGMERFAGHRFNVLKNVTTIFDERAWKMVSVRNTVLLKDVICDGRGMYDKEGCDRCCFFFWKNKWLRKLEQVAP